MKLKALRTSCPGLTACNLWTEARLLKKLWILLITLTFLSCSKGRQLTPNCKLIKNETGVFALDVVYSPNYKKRYEPIEKIGSNGGTVLIYYPEDGVKGWTYIFDGGDVMVKSWGHYTDKEFLSRAKELEIEGYKVYEVNEFWKQY